ncbi:hypothetical protein EXE10_03805 [Acinetobacter sp. WCHAc060033]|uniref:restriction endonuclease subunit S n=1 Tax=Acinetobacter sp. WCHAc060033 TaxID=2518624 RepID=UPI0010232561|nr:restriction endonuclease subunit S [Acinetobacter sp. WCHAc060033]RZG87994.1 hypothetical protein EXE10_03805 [Acinetobacter sp. WCHAc060033]
MSLDKLPVEWSVTGLESLSEFIIGGDWGKDLSFADESYIDAFCIRGSEFKNWKTDKGKTAVPRKLKISSLNTRRLKVGDILVEISGGGPDQPVGRTVYIEELVFNNLDSEDIVCTNFLRLFRPISSINAKYLNFYLSFFYKTPEIVNYQSGSNNLRNLQFKDYLKLEIPMAPLAEQQEIVRQLDMMLAQVEQIKARLDVIPAILKKFRQSVLASYFPENPISSEYVICTLKDICTSISDGDHQAPPKAKTGIPFLVISDVSKEEVDLESASRFVPQSYYDSLKDIRKPNKGDILYTVTGSFGIPIPLKKEEDFCFQRHIAILKLNKLQVEQQYLYYLLKSEFVYQQADKTATGTAQKTVALSSLRNFTVHIPSLAEQSKIMKSIQGLFDYADSIEEIIQSAQKRVNSLTQSILAKAFSGELTAEWRQQHQELITGINSAESLLAKIQAEREASKPAKKTRKNKEV